MSIESYHSVVSSKRSTIDLTEETDATPPPLPNNKLKELHFRRKLIKMVKRRPMLYDPAHIHFSNIKAKEEVWNRLAKKIDRDVETCQTIWMDLRHEYQNYARKLYKFLNSGNANNQRRPIMLFAENMIFMWRIIRKDLPIRPRPVVKPKTKSNCTGNADTITVDSITIDLQSSTSASQQPHQQSPPPLLISHVYSVGPVPQHSDTGPMPLNPMVLVPSVTAEPPRPVEVLALLPCNDAGNTSGEQPQPQQQPEPRPPSITHASYIEVIPASADDDDIVILEERPVVIDLSDEDERDAMALKFLNTIPITPDIEKLVQSIKLNRELYDTYHADFNDYKKRSAIWNAIAVDLKEKATKLMKFWWLLQTRYEWEFNKTLKYVGQHGELPDKMTKLEKYLDFLKPHIIRNKNTVCKQSYYLQDSWHEPIDNFKSIHSLMGLLGKKPAVVNVTDSLLSSKTKNGNFHRLWHEVAKTRGITPGQCECTWLLLRAFYWELMQMRVQGYSLQDKWYFESIISDVYIQANKLKNDAVVEVPAKSPIVAKTTTTTTAAIQKTTSDKETAAVVPTVSPRVVAPPKTPTPTPPAPAPAPTLPAPVPTIVAPVAVTTKSIATTTTTTPSSKPQTTTATPPVLQPQNKQFQIANGYRILKKSPHSKINTTNISIKGATMNAINTAPITSGAATAVPSTTAVATVTVERPAAPGTINGPPPTTQTVNVVANSIVNAVVPIAISSASALPKHDKNSVPSVVVSASTIPPTTAATSSQLPKAKANKTQEKLKPFARSIRSTPVSINKLQPLNILPIAMKSVEPTSPEEPTPPPQQHPPQQQPPQQHPPQQHPPQQHPPPQQPPKQQQPQQPSPPQQQQHLAVSITKNTSSTSHLNPNEIMIELVSSTHGNQLVVHGPPLDEKFSLSMTTCAAFIREIMAIPLLHNKTHNNPSLVNAYWKYLANKFKMPQNVGKACWNFLTENFSHFPQIAPMDELMRPFKIHMKVWRESSLLAAFDLEAVSNGWLQYQDRLPQLMEEIGKHSAFYRTLAKHRQIRAPIPVPSYEFANAKKVILDKFPDIPDALIIWSSFKNIFWRYMWELESAIANRWPMRWWRSFAKMKFLMEHRYNTMEPFYYIVRNKILEEIERCSEEESRQKWETQQMTNVVLANGEKATAVNETNAAEPTNNTIAQTTTIPAKRRKKSLPALQTADVKCVKLSPSPTASEECNKFELDAHQLMVVMLKYPDSYHPCDEAVKQKAWQNVAQEMKSTEEICRSTFQRALLNYYIFLDVDANSRCFLNQKYYKPMSEMLRHLKMPRKLSIRTPDELNRSVPTDERNQTCDVVLPERFIAEINMATCKPELVMKNWACAVATLKASNQRFMEAPLLAMFDKYKKKVNNKVTTAAAENHDKC